MRNVLTAVFLALLSLQFSHAQSPADIYSARRSGWMEKAEASKPELIQTRVYPVSLVKSVRDASAFQGWRMEKCNGLEDLRQRSFKEIDSFTVDFGEHLTGRFSIKFRTTSRVQDGPVRLKCTFAELPAELNTPLEPFQGTLSRGWMQDEIITIFNVDEPVTIDRRLSGRYMKIERLADSPDFDFALDSIWFTATSSAGELKTRLREDCNSEIRQINEVAVKTLRECMQTVYEDGPKRDQRLWIGDLYLESLANSYSFQAHELTKRCLYLLAGLASPTGQLWANVFENPEPHAQLGSYCLTYSLLFNVALLEYAEATGDMETASDLWCVARNQTEDALTYLDSDYVFDRNKKGGFVWLFMDWRAGLEESTAMQGLMAFVLDKTYQLAQMTGNASEVSAYPQIAGKMRKAGKEKLFDKQKGLFVSGHGKQVSWISQIWAILGGIVKADEGRKLLETVAQYPDALKVGSPYGNHYLVEAMLSCGMEEEAYRFVLDYWGGMIKKGADTFWEVYDPGDDYLSPYNFFPLNSACHAWSCTPAYFINKYPDIFQRQESARTPAKGLMLEMDNTGEVAAAMTLEEKARLLNGASASTLHNLDYVANADGSIPGAAGPTAEFPHWGIPPTIMADGPAGLRIAPFREGDDREYWCTAFPTGSALASTWNRSLVRETCKAMGEEVYANGVDVLLGPSMNIVRNPLCGRNFEYLSEDPLLSGMIAAAYVNGVQETGVGACIKHFAANNQETNRDGNDVIADEKTLREIYYRSFGIALRHSRPLTAMTSYNKIGGVYCCEDERLLEGILRGELGFDGMVMTDWTGIRDTKAQVLAGNDLIMPGSREQIDDIVEAVRQGVLPIEKVNRNAKRVLNYVVSTPSFKKSRGIGCEDFGNGYYNASEHSEKALEAACESAVLLKNNGVLPLKESASIALFGVRSYDYIAGGTGSGHVNCKATSQIDESLENNGFKVDAELRRLYHSHISHEWDRIHSSSAWVLMDFGHPALPEMKVDAETVSKSLLRNDLAIITIGRSAGEASDRSLTEHYYLSEGEIGSIRTVCDYYHSEGKPVVVILNIDGPIDMSSWDAYPDAILLSWLSGQEGGKAAANLVGGKENPSGRLPMSWPSDYWDNASAANFPSLTKAVPQPYMGFKETYLPSANGRNYDWTMYEEGVDVGYRHLLKNRIKAAYPFGFGLSYTEFKYNELKINRKDGQILIKCSVTNTGNFPGKEVIQIYVTSPESCSRELKAFGKTRKLNPGETEIVELIVDEEDLKSYSMESGCWYLPDGKYLFELCADAERPLIKSELRIAHKR